MSSIWNSIIGQEKAVDRLRNLTSSGVQSFLLVGPEGCGKEHAARVLASALITASNDPSSRESKLIVRGEFVDVHEIFRVGSAVDRDEAEDIVTQSATTPLESNRKVIIVHEVHLMKDSAAVRLLKTIEEPANHIFFILLADQLVPSLTTINSRCVVIQFVALSQDLIYSILVGEGVPDDKARSIAAVSHGNLDRARILVSDTHLFRRHEAFARIATELDGSGSKVVQIVAELMGHLEQSTESLQVRHDHELVELERRIALTGERGGNRKKIVERQKRELRKLRTDEMRTGLSHFASSYAEHIKKSTHVPDELFLTVDAIQKTISALSINVNEGLALYSLLLKCPPLTRFQRTI